MYDCHLVFVHPSEDRAFPYVHQELAPNSRLFYPCILSYFYSMVFFLYFSSFYQVQNQDAFKTQGGQVFPFARASRVPLALVRSRKGKRKDLTPFLI